MAAVKPQGVYLMAQSNAGLPKWENKQVHYDGTPEVMADYAIEDARARRKRPWRLLRQHPGAHPRHARGAGPVE